MRRTTGCQWENLPKDLPPSGTVYYYFNRWRKEKVWQQMNDTLREQVRREAGREATPSAGSMDNQDIEAQTGIDLEVVERDPGQVGFKPVPYRWVVERTFSWLSNYRRLSKDFEYWVYNADAMIYSAMVHLMLRRLARSAPI